MHVKVTTTSRVDEFYRWEVTATAAAAHTDPPSGELAQSLRDAAVPAVAIRYGERLPVAEAKAIGAALIALGERYCEAVRGQS